MAEITQITTEQKLEWVKGLANKDCRGPCDYCPPPINVLCGKIQPWPAPDYCDMIAAILADLKYAAKAREWEAKVAAVAETAERRALDRHRFQAMAGDPDYCALCGKNLREEIHALEPE